MSNEYNILVKQLDSFIRKYYRNELLRGLLLTFFIFTLSSLIAFVSEYLGHFDITTRTVIFYSITAAYVFVISKFIIWPLLRILQIGKLISHKQAAGIISSHFTQISDRLLNVLELAEMPSGNGYSQQLLLASIENKISSIRLLPFEAAINVKVNFKYLTYLAFAAAVFLTIYVVWPQVIKEGSDRLINHSVYYAPAPPFNFILENDTLNVEQGKDFNIKLRIEGKYVPKNAYVTIGSNKILLERLTPSTFSYNLKNVNNSIDFKFSAEEYSSEEYKLNVMPPPVITSFKVEVDVPQYTGESDFVLDNTGDFTIPCGSNIKWTFTTANVNVVNFLINDTLSQKVKQEEQQFFASYRFLNSSTYSLKLANNYINSTQPIKYNVNVIPDLYPGITCEFITDTSQMGTYYFKGVINDDYGFNKLTFNYKAGNSSDSLKIISVPVNKGSKYQEFYFAFDFSTLKDIGSEVEYFFEIWDNDGVHGSKSSRSAIKSYKIPSSSELEKYRENANKNIEEKLKTSSKLSEDIKRDIKKLQESLLNNKTNSWEQTKKLEDIVQKQNQLEQLVKELSLENKKKDSFLNTFSEQDQKLIEKQKQIEELLENVMDDEMKKLMEELKKLMDNFDKNKLNNIAEQMKSSYEDLNKQLDRNMEMLKRMDIEEKTDNLSKELEKLSEKQEKLSEETTDKKNSTDSLLKEQKEQQKKFEDLMKQYDDLQKKNEELKEPMDLKEFEQEKSDINNELNNSEESLKQNSRKGASKSQKNNSGQMKELSKKMQQMMEQSEMEQQEENAENMKQIIDNLEKFSFDVEALMGQTGKVSTTDPAYMKNMEKQKSLNNDFLLIKDSLASLANRSPMIGAEINKQIKKIEKLNKQTLSNLDERNAGMAKANQQYIMTGANDLALLLGEMLQQMQSQSQSQCSGSKCKNPGKGKPSMSQMQSMQKSIKSQMQSMIDELKKGNGQKDGKGMNEKIGKMISMQDKFNQMLNNMMQNGGLSPETAKQLQEIKTMVNSVEKDIINKSITPQTMIRQEQILTRLLEAEKSDYERETENKRESNEGKNNKFSNPEQIFKYKGVNSRYNEILEGSKIKLSKYYSDKYKEYMIHLNE